MRQVILGGLRKPDAECDVYILDERLAMIESFIPTRFRQAWVDRGRVEGAQVEQTLSKAERDPQVRKSALRHFGRRCMSCDFVPKVDSQLEVHHLHPLANGGERVTRIESDVAVLCANCHRLAHSANPPLTIEVLQGFHRSAIAER